MSSGKLKDAQAIADQVLAAFGGSVGDVAVQCLSCGRAEFIVMSAIRKGGVGAWTCSECGQRHEVRNRVENSYRERVQVKRPEDEWES